MLLRRTRSRPLAYLYQPSDENELLRSPESGPGYQIFRVGPQGRRARPLASGDYLALNAELLVPIKITLDNVWDPTIVWKGERTYDDYKAALNPTVITSLGGTVTTVPGTGTAGQPRSTLILSGSTTAGQVLWRVSAYYPDHRITKRNELLAGAYVTSDLDRSYINTGLGAVGRYALPTPLPSRYAYAVHPATGTLYDAGTVRPAYGQAGGGVELVLQSTTPVGSVRPPTQLPDL